MLIAMAGAPDPALVREEGLVADAAAAVAMARHDGLRASRVAELMATYRQEAERLASMQRAPDTATEQRLHDAALHTLTDATARGTEDTAARSTVEAWLGALPARLDLLDQALAAAATSPSELAHPIAADVESQAVAVIVTAIYDATRADEAARSARTRAAALRAESNPLDHASLSAEVEMRGLEQAANSATTRALALRTLAARAAALRDAAHLLSEN